MPSTTASGGQIRKSAFTEVNGFGARITLPDQPDADLDRIAQSNALGSESPMTSNRFSVITGWSSRPVGTSQARRPDHVTVAKSEAVASRPPRFPGGWRSETIKYSGAGRKLARRCDSLSPPEFAANEQGRGASST